MRKCRKPLGASAARTLSTIGSTSVINDVLTLLRWNEASLRADVSGLWPDKGSAPSDRSDRGNSESRISAGRKLAGTGGRDLDGVHGGVTWTMSWTLEQRAGWFSSSNALVACWAIRNERRRLQRMRWDFLGRVTERAWSRLPRVLVGPQLKSKPSISASATS